VPELVRDGIDGLLVAVGDASALGAAIGRVLCEPALRSALATSGRQRVQQFSMDRTVEGTLAVYRTLGPGGAAAGSGAA
jgi:glycosyltransferase involved in cell wall biosynthesis